jgi:methylated-DNA-[protein]-cysteine S-methyltransferase
MIRYTLFDTAIGWAGLAWGEGGLVAVQLPESDPEVARHGLLRRVPDAVEVSVLSDADGYIEAVIADIRALLRGDKPDLLAAPLDLTLVPEFDARVYAFARTIPAGETLTYGEIAQRLSPDASEDWTIAREVGAALGRNRWPIIVPCHRVTAAGGKPGGFSARGGTRTKLKLLAVEGARTVAQADLFD